MPTIIGVGGMQQPKQSAKQLSFKGPEGQLARTAPLCYQCPAHYGAEVFEVSGALCCRCIFIKGH